jgi:hypothetical protein
MFEKYAAFVGAVFLQNVKERSDRHLDFFVTLRFDDDNYGPLRPGV